MAEPPTAPDGARQARLDEIAAVGTGLVRPECVLATSQGALFAADWRGGVSHIRPDGSQALYLADRVDGELLKPNGIALRRDGTFLLAHLGDTRGGVFSMDRRGRVGEFLLRVDGEDLPPTNFVVEDRLGRFWVTVSTRKSPRSLGYGRDCDDGFVVMVDRSGARIVADGLGYTNECAVSADGHWLLVNETFTRRLSRFPIRPDGSLGARQVVAEFGAGTFPDGIALDIEGNAWVTSIVSNRLIRVDPQGDVEIWLEDVEPEHLHWVEQAYKADTMGREHLGEVRSRRLRNISSLAFGDPDLRTGYLGCLLGDSLMSLPMPAAGLQPVHWNYPA